MGEYNDTIREQIKLVENLANVVKIYKEAICTGIMLVNTNGIEEYTQKENLKVFYNEWFEEYLSEIERLRITGKGEVYYKEELYHSKDNVASIVKQHIEILETLSGGLFNNCEGLMKKQLEYIDFLHEFVKYRRNH